DFEINFKSLYKYKKKPCNYGEKYFLLNFKYVCFPNASSMYMSQLYSLPKIQIRYNFYLYLILKQFNH
ncbi:MAG: hypothetical protein RR161_03515, partial [Bacilli bacterium]